MIHKISSRQIGKLAVVTILFLPLLFYGWRASLRPP